ncbi:UPF0280 family protein [Hypericibacter sp.]|uniref:UPF0280 family protein n=1 Tax=Hypericibacter sp. TaxID=2705401 RepID=UPI003D6D0758
MARAQIALLPDGRRLHLQDGPIDLIIEAWGAHGAVEAAYRAAADRFVTILDELCTELPLLRSAADSSRCELTGIVARRLHAAVAPFANDIFITPMAAVAGAVAEEVLGAMTAAPLARAYVNNGGDIALHLAPGEAFTIAMIDRPDRPSLFGTVTIAAEEPVRGIATSGWRGRSFSLGIADAVTVLAPTAAMADAAATVIANAVDLPGHPGILRVPATDLQPDSDLGGHLVTRHVPELTRGQIAAALDAGEAAALSLQARNLIAAAALHLQGQTRFISVASDNIAPQLPNPALMKATAHA